MALGDSPCSLRVRRRASGRKGQDSQRGGATGSGGGDGGKAVGAASQRLTVECVAPTWRPIARGENPSRAKAWARTISWWRAIFRSYWGGVGGGGRAPSAALGRGRSGPPCRRGADRGGAGTARRTPSITVRTARVTRRVPWNRQS
jgi:hypothetical protein